MKTIISIIIGFICLPTQAQDMQQYLTDTEIMVREGKYQEALDRHIWFHDHVLEYNPGMVGVRLSFALSYWKSLGEDYPPAMAALKEIRDRKTVQILDEGGSFDLFADVQALNRTLDETYKSIELFETIATKQPLLAKEYLHVVKDDLFAAKRYDILKNFIENPMYEYSIIEAGYYRDTAMFKDDAMCGAFLETYSKDYFVTRNMQLISFCLATNDLNSARQIQEKALAIIDDKRLLSFKF